MHCSECRLFFPDGSKAPCKLCGKALKKDEVCRKCGTRNVEGIEECSLCGASIKDPLRSVSPGSEKSVLNRPVPVRSVYRKPEVLSRVTGSRSPESGDREEKILRKELDASAWDILLAMIFIVLTWASIFGIAEKEDRAMAFVVLFMAYGYGCHKVGTDSGKDLADAVLKNFGDDLKCTPMGNIYWKILAVMFITALPYSVHCYFGAAAPISAFMVWVGVFGLLSLIWMFHFVTCRSVGFKGRCEAAADFFNTLVALFAVIVVMCFIFILAEAD